MINRKKLKKKVGWLGVLAGLALVILLLRWLITEDELRRLLVWFEGRGAAGHLLFFIAATLVIPLMIPHTAFELGAGILFPYWLGVLYVVSAEALGSLAAFLTGRHGLPVRMRRRILARRNVRLAAHALSEQGWKTIALTRLILGFPFKLSNYAFGVTPVGTWSFFIGNMLGIVPRCLAVAYIGSLIGDLATVEERGARSSEEWLILGGMGVIAVVALIALAIHARRAWARQAAVLEAEENRAAGD